MDTREQSSLTRLSGAPRVLLVGVLIGLIATAVDYLLARIAVPLVGARPDYPSLTLWPIVAACMTAAVGAAVVWLVVARRSRRPRPTFLAISAVVLVVSLVLPILPVVNPQPRFAGADWAIALVLMGLHVLTAAIVVPALPRFGPTPASSAA